MKMNDRADVIGQVFLPVGQYWFTGPNGHHVHYAPSGMDPSKVLDLGGINDAGQVAGTYTSTTPGSEGDHAFISGPGAQGFIDLNPPGTVGSAARGIDETGRVAGIVSTPAGWEAAYTDADGKWHTLGMLGGTSSSAKGLNARGMVYGLYGLSTGDLRSFVTGPDGVGMADLGSFASGSGVGAPLGGSDFTVAYDINAAGDVVGGAYEPSGVYTAFIVSPGSRTLLSIPALDGTGRYGSQASGAFGIDDAGHVVGGARDGESSVGFGFVTGRNGKRMHDLNDFVRMPTGLRIISAAGINARGQIAAYASDGSGAIATLWLLTPTRATWADEIEAGR